MLTTTDFLIASKWAGILTLGCAALTLLAFVLKWGFRFRFVGATGFMGVLTGGLFALSLGLFSHTTIPGAIRYSVVFDNGATLASIAVPPTITQSELDATLRQAAADLFSYGRLGSDSLVIRARTMVHPEAGVSQPLILGEVRRSLTNGENDNFAVKIYAENLAKLPKPTA
ncbi:Ycf51 family protein [Phormidium sp. LEGE 05292]|uniref:Ycf51 family protein n=1 Tax=[Phormidium] sp. LEGE 05292 TaxID=767427 RepID=UPI00187E69A3|nr:Ycf51 family protein [Phormidium sp. LEGE 05292]MBE9226679.1 Ycf51 family protein [Phormidium sp. LEGE 05292]